MDNAVQSGEKIVVIARFLAEIKAIEKLLEKKHILYSQVSGEGTMFEMPSDNPDKTDAVKILSSYLILSSNVHVL